MKFLKLFPIDLSLFGEDGAQEGEVTQSNEVTAQSGQSEDEARESGNRRRKSDNSKVIYGKQEQKDSESVSDDLAAENQTEPTLDEQFEEMIKGDFREIYDKKVQSHIKRRLGNVKQIENENRDMKAVMDVLAQKYQSDDPKEILTRLEGDNSLWEQAAEAAGLSVEQYKKSQSLEREVTRLRAAEQIRQREAEAARVYKTWLTEANEVIKTYPDFKLSEEIKNPDFRGLIENNIPMKKAYETIHLNDIVKGVSEFSAKRAEENAVLNIQKRAARPSENISSSSAGVVIRDDPSALTKKDREEIIRRAQRGEIISF